METRANYILVGGFMLALGIGILGFFVWLAKVEFDVHYARYDIYFADEVTGLNVGSAVRFAGVRVGEVIDIRLNEADASRVHVIIEIDASTPVRTSTVASLEVAGLTGGRYILLTSEGPAGDMLTKKEGRQRPEIPSRESSLSSLLKGAPDVIAAANMLLGQANMLLSDENIRSLSGSIANVESVTGTLAARSGDIDAIIRDAATTMADISEATAAMTALAARAEETLTAFESTADLTAGEVRLLSAEMQKTAAAIRDMTGEIEFMIAENREPLRDFTNAGLFELATMITEARKLMVTLNNVATDLQRDPARFLFGDKQAGFEPTE